LTRDGIGLCRIRGILNGEGVPGPSRGENVPRTKAEIAAGVKVGEKGMRDGKWSPTSVREVLNCRDYTGDIYTNRIQRAWDDENEKAIRIEQPGAEWKHRKDESLRIVSDELWHAAHARVASTVKSYLRRGNQLVGKVESTKGSYLLSGFLSCGICHHALIINKRGRGAVAMYVCREHREGQSCTNAAGVPMAELHEAVIQSLRETFSVESFTAHLERQAADSGAREQRAAERANLLAEVPKLAATEARLVRRIATVEDDALVGALKGEWSEARASREWAERRVAELEGIERDLAADRSEVEALRETWKTWSATLEKATYAPAGSVPAEAQAQARQILRKVLVGTIEVTPLAEKIDGRPSWSFLGYSRFDGVVLGGLTKGESFNVVLRDAKTGEVLTQDVDTLVKAGYRPISGGSDAGCGTERSTDGPPKPPALGDAPAEPGRPSMFRHGRGGLDGPTCPPPPPGPGSTS